MTSVKTAAQLADLFKKKLATSGLDLKDAKKLQMEPLLAAQTIKLGVPGFASFKIPYFSESGASTQFFRVRYLETTKTGFTALTTAKDQRYGQPPKTINEVYLPPFVNWKEYLSDPAAPLIITEGELKAACASKLGLHTVGLGGVWTWRSVKNNIPILPWFSKARFEGREVFIVYDSDSATNYQVMAAENALARSLTDLGAVPCIIRLPSISDDPKFKTGLDDYLLARSVGEFQALMDGASAFNEAENLHQLNEEVIYIRNPGVVLRLDNVQRMTPRAFIDHAYATRTYLESDGAEKPKFVEKSAPKEWIKWPGRSEVERVTYAPGSERITDKGEFNTWKGWACEPKRGSVAPWKNLIAHLFSSAEPGVAKWFEQWCAYPIQFPGTKLSTSPLIHSKEQGIGKSAVGYCLRGIYGENWAEISNEELSSLHNEWAENKQFVMGDEIAGGDKRSSSDRMKSRITQRELRLNPKYVPAYVIPDTINYYFTSNHPDAFFMDDKDRRYMVHEAIGAPLGDAFYNNLFDDWLKKDGVAHLFAHLLELDLAGFNPFGPAPTTRSKYNMINIGRSDIGDWIARIREDPDSVLRLQGKILDWRLWRPDDLLALYDPDTRTRVTANGISRELKRTGFTQAAGGLGLRTLSCGQARLWILRDETKMAMLTPTELGQWYDSERNYELVNAKRKKI